MAATEAAGEGINLQFCWFMINYDIPWNPMRLEQRMGRIHRYGQEKDCLILNFVSTKTREGRVLQKLFERIEQIEKDLDPQNTGKVFNVLGDVLPANQLERMLRDMYANITSEDAIKSRIVEEVDIDRFRQITEHTLEGLAKKELNLSAILGKSEEAKERRLVPEVIEDFFLKAAPLTGITLKEVKQTPHIYRLGGKVPRNLWPIGEALEGQFGKLGKEYKQIVFDKALLAKDSTSGMGDTGPSTIRGSQDCALRKVEEDLRSGAIFFDLYSKEPSRLDVYSAAVKDGRGNVIHRRIFVAQTDMAGTITIRQPTIFLDLIPSTAQASPPDGNGLPERDRIEQVSVQYGAVAFPARDKRPEDKGD